MFRTILFCSLVLSLGCERKNGAYCDATTPCGDGLSCDLVSHACTDAPLDMSAADDLSDPGDLSGADLLLVCTPACTGTTPLCTQGTCGECTKASDPEAACAALDPTTPHCLNAGADNGACANCRTAADCSDPAKRICPEKTHVCRGCVADSECASLVCDLTPSSATLGRCVPANQVFYANGNAGMCNDANNATTPALAVCKLGIALDKAKNGGGTTVRIAAVSNGSYNTENVEVDNFAIALIGEPGAIIKPSGNNNPALLIKGAAPQVLVRGLVFTQGTGAKGSGIRCEGTATGKLTVLESIVTDNDQFGIEGDGCDQVVVDRSAVGKYPTIYPAGNTAGGIHVNKAFRVTNCLIAKNDGSGVKIDSPDTVMRELNNNTIVENITGIGFGGADCSAINKPTISGNIFYVNKTIATSSATNCTTAYTATDDLTDGARTNNVSLVAQVPGFVSITDYHLTATSPCKDKGQPSGAPDHDFDGAPRPDKTTTKVDIGAYEVQ